MSYRSFIIVQGSLSNNLYWIYALLSRNQPCRDYALWEALFGQIWWEEAQKHFNGPGNTGLNMRKLLPQEGSGSSTLHHFNGKQTLIFRLKIYFSRLLRT